MNTPHLSFRQLFTTAFILCIGLFAAAALQAWTGPTASAPSGNVSAPINTGTTDQVKDAGISVNSLAVFGAQYIENALGIGRVSPVVALDVNGSVRIADGGEVCQAVTEGSIRYNASSVAMEYCDGSAWTAFGGGATLSAIRTYTTGTNAAYTTPSIVSYIVVEVWGGGGGGSPGTAGGSGGTTCFGTNATACTTPLLQATGGAGGNPNSAGAGGAGGAGSGGDLNLTGAAGDASYFISDGRTSGNGGSAPRGGGGGVGGYTQGTAGGSGGDFGGGGGGGGYANYGSPGAGGGSGGYSMKLITSPEATYKYTVGSGGSASGNNGTYAGTGGSGGIVIQEYTTQ